MGRRPRSLIARTLLVAGLVLSTGASGALELWAEEDGPRELTLDTTWKTTGLATYALDEPVLYEDEWSGLGLFRLRLGLNLKLSDTLNSELAYEQRASLSTGGSAGGTGVIPSFGGAPYRLGQLDWQIAKDGDTFSYRHEIDRALVAWHPKWGEVIVGRQAIGLGRGAMFGALDVFSPFSPAEVDREWRRGVDAVRVEYRMTGTSSVEFLGVFDERWDQSALLLRARGYVGEIDGELILGKRGEDAVLGGAMSAVLGDAEIHLELATFYTPESQPDGGLFGIDHLVGKAVLGSSYTFDVGNGLTVMGEYHYSGFGVKDVADATMRFADPDFLMRFMRGDMQILGRHALGVTVTYPFNDAWAGSFLWLQSPVDGSGTISPGVTWSVTENTTVQMNAFIPWGEGADHGRIQSEYGSSPFSVFLQVSMYF
ncbi:MAG: hypothetical protein GY851_22725 [bacterium]|nr:hypothetical protein [bacterium]